MTHCIQPKKHLVKVVLLNDKVSTSHQRGKKVMGLDTMDMIKKDDLDNNQDDNNGQDKMENDGDKNKVS
jgi:hypothetical protein